MRYLAVDLGDRRTGLAVGDDETGLVQVVGVLEIPRGPALRDAVVRAVAEYGADEVVLGLPLHMDDREGDRAKIARTFGGELQAAAAKPVRYQDERLTSWQADQNMARSGRTRGAKKRIRDAVAAAEILRDFLETGGTP